MSDYTKTPVLNNIELKQVNFDDPDAPSQEEIEFYHNENPEIPKWYMAALLLFYRKNPHYKTTGCLGKKAPSAKQIRESKRKSTNSQITLQPSWIDTRMDGEQEWTQEKCRSTFETNNNKNSQILISNK